VRALRTYIKVFDSTLTVDDWIPWSNVVEDFQISYKPYRIPDISVASMITPSQMASKAG
jgi:hypothetical protein